MSKTKIDLIDRDKIPVHIAIIMDGNGRWARKQGFARIKGHNTGVETIRNIVTFSNEIGLKYLTLYAFSIENWGRPKREIKLLMKLLDKYLADELSLFLENNIRFNVIGLIEGLPLEIQKKIKYNMESTKNNTGLTLTLALNYSGRSEITTAVKNIVKDASSGKISSIDITEDFISSYLFTNDLPDPDLLIRTSGEMRVSNFLLWQISYSEIWITPVLWPDFSQNHLAEAVVDYQKRERRFGKV
ncbi:isoprenyl transferase [bacterium]|nr:isoprenyl transferase [bacterium]